MTNDVTAAADLVAPEATRTLDLILRAALDPAVSPEKMSALFDLHARMADRAARLEFAAALSRAQARFPIIERKGKIAYEAKKPGDAAPKPIEYALWEDVVSAITKPLSEEGLSLSFDDDIQQIGESYRIVIIGILRHRDGWTEKVKSPPLMHDGTGGKNSIQAIQSTVSYGKRMTAGMLINFASRGEDDDGANGAKTEGAETVDEAQYRELAVEITLQGSEKTLPAVLKHFGIESLGDLPAARFQEAMDRLKLRRERAKGGAA